MNYDWVDELLDLVHCDLVYENNNIISVERLVGSVKIIPGSMKLRVFDNIKQYDYIVEADTNAPFNKLYFLLKRYSNDNFYVIKAVSYIYNGDYYYFDELNMDEIMIYQKTHRLSIYDNYSFENFYNYCKDDNMLPTRDMFTQVSIEPDFSKDYYTEDKVNKRSSLILSMSEYNDNSSVRYRK